jgi:hypothetical protein
LFLTIIHNTLKKIHLREDVKAYVKRNKNDAADAEAICEAVRRPTMRFVRIKSPEQQAIPTSMPGRSPAAMAIEAGRAIVPILGEIEKDVLFNAF